MEQFFTAEAQRAQRFAEVKQGVQGSVRRVVHEGRACVLKSPRVGLFTSVNRWLLERERKAYRELSGVEGIPACFGMTAEGLMLEDVTGEPLSDFRKGRISVEFLDALDRRIEDIHERGVVHSDLKKRENILVVEKTGEVGRRTGEILEKSGEELLLPNFTQTSPDFSNASPILSTSSPSFRQTPVIVDFGAALFVGEPFYETFRAVDLAAAAKLRAHHQPETLREEQKFLLEHPTWAERLSRFLIHTVRDPFRKVLGQG